MATQPQDLEINWNDLFSYSAVQNISKFRDFVANLTNKYPNTDIKQAIKEMHDKKGMNYLHCASIYDSFEIIPILLDEYHIDINHLDNNGYPPIFYTVNNLDSQCIEQLIKHKPEINFKTIDSVIEGIGFPIYACGGQTIFHILAEKNGAECLKPLLKYLLNEYKHNMMDILLIKDNNGYSAMDIAIMFNRINILKEMNGFMRTYCNYNININDKIPNKEIRETMQKEYVLQIRQRIDRNNRKYEKINEHPDKFQNEQTNYAVFVEEKEEKQLCGMIREIKVFDQFDDEKYAKLAEKYNKKEGICGHITVCIAKYIIETLIKSRNDLIFDFHDKVFNDIIYKELCDEIIVDSVEKCMQFTLVWRQKYIENHKNEFDKNNTLTSPQYLALPCANFELSDYIQYQLKDRVASKIIFIRMNTLENLNQSQHELKQRIFKDEKLFDSETFIIEFFVPRKLVKVCEFNKELKQRNMKPECIVYLFDLNGHYNCGFAVRIEGQRNIVLVDTYTANHVKNQTALKCFELVFDCMLNQNK